MRSRPEAIAVRIVFTFLQWISYRKAIIISPASVEGLLTMLLLHGVLVEGNNCSGKNANWFLLSLVVAQCTLWCACTLQIWCWHCFAIVGYCFICCNFSWWSVVFRRPTFLPNNSGSLCFSFSSFIRSPDAEKMSSMVEFMWSTVFRSRHFVMLHDRRRQCPFVVNNACRRWASMNVPETIWCWALKDNRSSVRNYCFFLICVATLLFVRSSYFFFIFVCSLTKSSENE